MADSGGTEKDRKVKKKLAHLKKPKTQKILKELRREENNPQGIKEKRIALFFFKAGLILTLTGLIWTLLTNFKKIGTSLEWQINYLQLGLIIVGFILIVIYLFYGEMKGLLV